MGLVCRTEANRLRALFDLTQGQHVPELHTVNAWALWVPVVPPTFANFSLEKRVKKLHVLKYSFRPEFSWYASLHRSYRAAVFPQNEERDSGALAGLCPH